MDLDRQCVLTKAKLAANCPAGMNKLKLICYQVLKERKKQDNFTV